MGAALVWVAAWSEGHETALGVITMGLAGVVIGMAAARRVLDRRHRSRRRNHNKERLF